MATFQTRAPVNKIPDFLGDVYEFVKINLDEFIAFVDGLVDPISRELGAVAMFLNHTRPEYDWYLTPDRIYFTLQSPESMLLESDVAYVLPLVGTVRIPTGTKVWKVHPNKFSETQKWVKRLEERTMAHPEATIDQPLMRQWVKEATGK